MSDCHLQELIALEDTYWWHIAKRQLLTELLQRTLPPPGLVVEGGTGSARNLLELQRLGYEVAGLELLSEAVQHAHNRGLERVVVHNLEDCWPVARHSARAVVLLDVLEHLADPVKVLSFAREALAPGGGVIVNVPAYPGLFSEWDRSLGHYRRYTAGLLRSQSKAAGFRVRWISHWNAFTLPAAVLYRKLDWLFHRQSRAEFPRVSETVNRLLMKCAELERRFLSRRPLPFGLSLMGVLTP